MNTQAIKILLIEANSDDAHLVEHMLHHSPHMMYDLSVVNQLQAGVEFLAKTPVDAVLLNLSLPDSTGVQTLVKIQAATPNTATIILADSDNQDLVTEAIKTGAQDFLVKQEFNSASLSRSIRCAIERVRRAQHRFQNEDNFRGVMAQIIDGITLVDETGVIVEWNRAQEQISGMSHNEAIGRFVWDVQHQLAPPHRRSPAHYESLKKTFLTFLQTGQAPLWVRELCRTSGEVRAVQSTVSPIRTARGYMASIITRDVTDQQRAQQALEEAFLYSQYTLDAISTEIAVLDQSGVIIAVNEAWRKFADDNNLGDPNYAVGQNYLAICDRAEGPGADEAQVVAAGIRAALAHRQRDLRLEYACHGPAGPRWFVVEARSFDVGREQRVVITHYDITARILAQEALATERNLLRTLIDTLPDHIYIKDLEGRFIVRNAAAAHHMGAASPEEAIGKTDFDYYPRELAECYTADDQMVTQSGQPLYDREEPILSADSVAGWLLTTKVPLRDKSGQVVGLIGIGHDITRRKQDAERLERLHAEINALYTINKQLGQTLDLETIYRTIHSAIKEHVGCDGLRILSYSPEDRLIRCVWAWADGRQLDASQYPPIPLTEGDQGHQSQVILTGQSLYIPDCQNHLPALQTFYVVQDNGQTQEKEQADHHARIPQSTILLPLKLENRVLGVIQVFSYQPDAFSEDEQRFLNGLASQAAAVVANALLFEQAQHEVAERERAETALRHLNAILEDRIAERTAALRNSEARYRAIVEDQTELICRSKLDKTVTFVNNAYCRFYNLPREQIIGADFTPTVYAEDLPEWEEKYGLISPANPTLTIEHRTVGGDGKIHWMQWTNRLIVDENNQPLEIQGVGRDITRQKQSEEVLRQALTREMEVNEMRARFISMASHDLRTPLAIIQASIDLLSQYGDRLSPERKQRSFQELYQSFQQMVRLLDDILIIGRVDAGKIELEPEPLNLKTFCRNLLTELKTALGTSHHLNLAITGECEQLWMDSKLLRHILSNLISNAIKYSPSAESVEISLDCTHSQVMIKVQDHGIGIPLDEQKHLFETFFRASNARNIAGNGLGLAIVRQSVELHGGSISFESYPGEGTTFCVILPSIPVKENVNEYRVSRG